MKPGTAAVDVSVAVVVVDGPSPEDDDESLGGAEADGRAPCVVVRGEGVVGDFCGYVGAVVVRGGVVVPGAGVAVADDPATRGDPVTPPVTGAFPVVVERDDAAPEAQSADPITPEAPVSP